VTDPLIPAVGDDWPDWRDAQRRVWIRLDGCVWHGTLQADDFGFDGEGEYPIWSVYTENHGSFSLADATEWGYEVGA
jgi:hypothetical protein